MRGRLALSLMLVSCSSDGADLPAPDFEDFRRDVYPVLLSDCGMSRCHGDTDRFFVVWGPGRTRIQPLDEVGSADGSGSDESGESDPSIELSPLDPPTETEIWLSYQRTRSALVHDAAIEDSPLLSKPLVGRSHGGEDRWGRNLWTQTDPRWLLLRRWAAGESTLGQSQP